MSGKAMLVTMFLATAALAFGQELPGRWKDQVPTQSPGGHESETGNKDEEIARLKALVEQQDKKIQLLEQKVRILERGLNKEKGTAR